MDKKLFSFELNEEIELNDTHVFFSFLIFYDKQNNPNKSVECELAFPINRNLEEVKSKFVAVGYNSIPIMEFLDEKEVVSIFLNFLNKKNYLSKVLNVDICFLLSSLDYSNAKFLEFDHHTYNLSKEFSGYTINLFKYPQKGKLTIFYISFLLEGKEYKIYKNCLGDDDWDVIHPSKDQINSLKLKELFEDYK